MSHFLKDSFKNSLGSRGSSKAVLSAVSCGVAQQTKQELAARSKAVSSFFNLD